MFTMKLLSRDQVIIPEESEAVTTVLPDTFPAFFD
jgi:hypothetical protein